MDKDNAWECNNLSDNITPWFAVTKIQCLKPHKIGGLWSIGLETAECRKSQHEKTTQAQTTIPQALGPIPRHL